MKWLWGAGIKKDEAFHESIVRPYLSCGVRVICWITLLKIYDENTPNTESAQQHARLCQTWLSSLLCPMDNYNFGHHICPLEDMGRHNGKTLRRGATKLTLGPVMLPDVPSDWWLPGWGLQKIKQVKSLAILPLSTHQRKCVYPQWRYEVLIPCG